MGPAELADDGNWIDWDTFAEFVVRIERSVTEGDSPPGKTRFVAKPLTPTALARQRGHLRHPGTAPGAAAASLRGSRRGGATMVGRGTTSVQGRGRHAGLGRHAVTFVGDHAHDAYHRSDGLSGGGPVLRALELARGTDGWPVPTPP